MNLDRKMLEMVVAKNDTDLLMRYVEDLIASAVYSATVDMVAVVRDQLTSFNDEANLAMMRAGKALIDHGKEVAPR